ncbi:MAG TPA: anti-sigma factor [Burkholderiaceae bacterium]|nr:anti-sigma factor [Burkholderiaceae bacterium]
MNHRASWDRLAAEYALGTLRGAARARFETMLSRYPELAAATARWQDALGVLDSHDAPVQPPDRVWRAILSRLPPAQQTPQGTPSSQQHTMGVRGRARLFVDRWGWRLASLTLAAGLLVSVLRPFHPQSSGVTPSPIAVLSSSQPTTPRQELVISLDATKKKLIVTPLDLRQPEADHSLQLWLIAPGRKPASLGLIAAETTTVIDLHAQRLNQGIALAVSIEPLGGSPTGQPTGAVLYAGKVGRT